MKNILWILLASLAISSCQGKAQKETGQQTGSPGQEKTSDYSSTSTSPASEGITMKAVIDGKEWVATKMIPDYGEGSNYRTIHGETDDHSISFNIYKPTAGVKRELNDDYAISLISNDGFYGGRKGFVEIVMADEYWIEGRFEFTATTSESDRTVSVTNGFFRVATNDPDKRSN